jgi:hypothetical protein
MPRTPKSSEQPQFSLKLVSKGKPTHGMAWLGLQKNYTLYFRQEKQRVMMRKG